MTEAKRAPALAPPPMLAGPADLWERKSPAMRRSLVISAALLLAAATAGCASGSPSATGGSPTTAASTVQSSSPTPAVPSPSPEATFGLGATQPGPSGGTVTVLDYSQPVAQDAPQPADAGYPDGYVWAALDVKVCVPDTPPDEGYDTYYVTTTVWRLAFPDGALVETSHTGYTGFPQPEYPWGDTEVLPGQCVRGWLVFPVPAGQRPEAVHYTGGGGVLRWQFAEQG